MPNKRGFSQKQYKTIRKMIQSDKSYKEKQSASGVIGLTSSGNLSEFTSIAEGDDFNVRASDKCYLTKIEMQMEVISGSSTTNDTVRIIVGRGRNGSLSTADFPSTTGAVNTDKIQVYYDRLVIINDNQTQARRFSFNKSFSKGKIPHMVLRYDDDVSAFSCQHNPVYLWAVSDHPVSVGAPDSAQIITANFYDTA